MIRMQHFAAGSRLAVRLHYLSSRLRKASRARGSNRSDYRGQQVMAVWRYLPSLRWAMVVKIDAAEAFAPIVKQRNTVLIVGSITLLCVVLGALLVARSLLQAHSLADARGTLDVRR